MRLHISLSTLELYLHMLVLCVEVILTAHLLNLVNLTWQIATRP